MKSLRIEGLSVLLGECAIIRDIALEIDEGEALFLIGANGSGKSTLLHTLMGTLDKNKLSVDASGFSVFEKDHKDYSIRELSQKMTAVFQRPEIHPLMKVDQYLRLSRFQKRENTELFEEILERLEISSFLSRELMTLSGGEFKRVAIAAALYQETPLVLLDEPFQALDPRAKEIVAHAIEYFKKEKNVSFIIASHDFYFSHYLSDKALFLRHGERVIFGKSKDVFTKESLDQTFGFPFFRFEGDNGKGFLYPSHGRER